MMTNLTKWIWFLVLASYSVAVGVLVSALEGESGAAFTESGLFLNPIQLAGAFGYALSLLFMSWAVSCLLLSVKIYRNRSQVLRPLFIVTSIVMFLFSALMIGGLYA